MITTNHSLAAPTTREKLKSEIQPNDIKNLYQPQHVSYFANKVMDRLKNQNPIKKEEDKKLPLPPYGSNLDRSIKEGNIPTHDVYIFIGHFAMKKGAFFSKYRFCLCLPPTMEPTQYTWPVCHCYVLVFETTKTPTAYIERTVLCLLDSGATIVRVTTVDSKVYIYRRQKETI